MSAVGWYVHCGCDKHSDHFACGQTCVDLGVCRHPLGVAASAATEEEADQRSGKPVTDPEPDLVPVEYHVAFTTPGHQSDGIITLAKRPSDTTRLTASDLAKARDLIAQRTHVRPDQVVILNIIRLHPTEETS